MLNFLEDIVGPDYAMAAFMAIVAILLVAILLGLLYVLRRMRAGTYVAGGRNRRARLSIMDAAAVDSHRRLVLVRRDDVEHLLLIGGNSDIVVERDIRLSGQARRPAPQAPAADAEAPVAAPRAPSPPPPRPTPAAQPRPAAPPVRTSPPPALAAPTRPTPPPRPVAPPARTKDQLDDDLMKELESALDVEDRAPEVAPPTAKPSLDDEMAKLLGELTNQKR